MSSKRFAAVILAAGFSSRMKCFKPLLPLGGETIIDHLISIFLSNNLDIFLVAGWEKEKLIGAIKNRSIKVVENPDFNKGMFSSVQAGLRQVHSDQYLGVLVHPVDVPLVRPFTMRRLLEAAEKNPGKIIYPSCGRKRGHPPLIPVEMVSTILEWQKEGGLKAVLEAYDRLAVEVRVPDIGIHFDIDTSGDYEVLLERFSHYDVPAEKEIEVIVSDICRIPQDRLSHCYKVAEVAGNIGKALVKAGKKIDADLVRTASILHDIAKGQKDHAKVGGSLLREMGFDKVGNIVSAHSELPDGIRGSSLEAKIVYLADKYVSGDSLVTIGQRYDQALERFSNSANIRSQIMRRREDAFEVEKEFVSILGYSMKDIIYR